jgi:flavin reductase (DIM6/NTAB) family NADH-FMN oxidoreductase RutF/trans-aconitate methyltransferase
MKKRLGSMNALYPMPVAIVGTMVKGKPNFITIAHFGILNANAPHLISVSMSKSHYTNAGIMENKTFSVNIPSENLMELTDYVGIVSGKKTDKSELFYITYGELETAPMINECPVSMECRLRNTIKLPTHDVFIGEVTSTYADESVSQGLKIDIVKLKPLLFDMASRKYFSLGQPLGTCWNTSNRLLQKDQAENLPLTEEFPTFLNPDKIPGKNLIEKLNLKGNESVLHIGCGEGNLTASIAEKLPDGHVVGIESSAELITSSKIAFGNIPNLKFMLLDAGRMPFENVFDIVFSYSFLHWIKDHEQLLAGIKNSLKPGGKVLFQMGGRGNAADFAACFFNSANKERWAEFFKGFRFSFNFMGAEEYGVMLRHAGLDPVRVELFPEDIRFTSKNEFSGWIRSSWAPLIAEIPNDLLDDFINDVINTFSKEYPPDDNGCLTLKTVTLEVEALKPY